MTREDAHKASIEALHMVNVAAPEKKDKQLSLSVIWRYASKGDDCHGAGMQA